MIETEFAVWLRGYMDLSNETYLKQRQLSVIMNHAKLVITTKGQASPTMHHFISLLEIWQNTSQNINRDEIFIILKQTGFTMLGD